jgi:hypothetical protein
MSAVIQATQAISRPGDNVRYARWNHLLAAGAPEGLGRTRAADPADEPFTITVRLTAGCSADGALQIKLGALGTSAMLSGHAPIVSVTLGLRRLIRR